MQKGGVPGIPSCIKYNNITSKIIEDAKRNQGDLVVLTNAYGTVPHKLVESMLKAYHVPEKFQQLLLF